MFASFNKLFPLQLKVYSLLHKPYFFNKTRLFFCLYLLIDKRNVCLYYQLNSLLFLLCKMNSAVIYLLIQSEVLVKYRILYFNLVFYLMENGIGPKTVIFALFGVMPIQRSITSWLLYPLYTWSLRPVSVPLFEAIRMPLPFQKENNSVLHNQKYIIVTLPFWKI